MATRQQRDQKDRKRTSAREWAEKQGQGFEPTAMRLPDGYELYKLEEGKRLIDIIPFIAGKDNPGADEGIEHFERTYFVHKIPRPDGGFDRYCCLWENWREPCPICHYRNDRARTEDEKSTLWAQRRVLFLINDKPGDVRNKLKVMDAVYFNRKLGFGEQLVEAMKAYRDDPDISDLKHGLTVQIMVADSKFGSVSRIDLLPRKYEYPKSILDDLPCLDDCVIKPKRSVLVDLLGMVGTNAAEQESRDVRKDADSAGRNGDGKTKSRGDGDDDEKPRSRRGKADDDDGDDDEPEEKPKKRTHDLPTAGDAEIEVGDTVKHKKWGRCEVTNVSGDGTSLRIRDADDEVHFGVAVDDVKKVEDEQEEEEEPSPRSRKSQSGGGKKPSHSKPVDPDPDDDDDEDSDDDDSEDAGGDGPEEEEEEEKPKAKKKVRR